MAKITLFEFSPEGSVQVGPSSPGEEGLLSISTDEDAETDAEAEDEESGGGLAKVIVPLLVLVAIGAAIRYATGETEEDLDEESEGRLEQFKTTTE
ncbi:hypothetical protein [Natronoarchaeum philippinense]|nr:hypothetical protein [Natronoarchaeum philippinense]